MHQVDGYQHIFQHGHGRAGTDIVLSKLREGFGPDFHQVLQAGDGVLPVVPEMGIGVEAAWVTGISIRDKGEALRGGLLYDIVLLSITPGDADLIPIPYRI